MTEWNPFARASGDHHEEDRLSALLDDELPEEDALEVTRHVARCDRCLADFNALFETRHALRSLPPVDTPLDLYASLVGGIPTVSSLDEGSRGLRLVAAVAAGAAILGAAAFVAGGAEQPGTVSPPVDVFVVDHVTRMEGGPMNPVDLGR